MQRTHRPSSNLMEMKALSFNHDHGIDIGTDINGGSPSSPVNVTEDMHQSMIVGDRSHHHVMGLSLSRARNKLNWARNKLLSLKNHVWNIRIMNLDHHLLHDRLCEAAKRGDWKTAEEMENTEKGILSRVISQDRKETALHIATRFKKAAFVEELVKKLSRKDLEAKNIYENTALCIAATSGDVDIAKSMVRRHDDLVLTRGSGNATPVLIAARYMHNNMVSYLLEAMDTIDQKMEIEEQTELLLSAISADHYDIALLILRWNEKLARERDINDDTPLHIMARKSNTIGSKSHATKWQSFINSCFKHIYKKEMMKAQAHQTVDMMWSVVRQMKEGERRNFISHPSSMLHDAASVGNVEFVRMLLHKNPELLRQGDDSGKNIFHVAIENRQQSIFDLIYDMKLFKPDDLPYYFKEENISLLELAAKRADPSHLDRVSGAIFQMHQELLWFKRVEDIGERTTTIKTETGKQTPRELFTQEHRSLVKEGEKWVKNTANSCMLVATLIATVVFTAAFTVPGGNDDSTGSPKFLEHKWFTVFVISDAIALIASSTSILLFLSILTSRCGETDFLFWLPLELVFGLGSLFLSVLGMVLAFSACFFLHYGRDIAWIPLLITGMAIVPIYWFCVLQWKLWTDGLVALHATGKSVACLT